jgi:hypothetical protein
VSVPGICDFLQVSFNSAACVSDLIRAQSDLSRKFDIGLDPELRFSVGVGHVNVRPTLFPGEEEQPEGTVTKNRRRHRETLHWSAATVCLVDLTILASLVVGNPRNAKAHQLLRICGLFKPALNLLF